MKSLFLILSFNFFMALSSISASCETKSAAWYVVSPADINDLERIKFNLFFLNHVDYGSMTKQRRHNFIQESINALSGCSQVILPIDNFLLSQWGGPNGMQEFVNTWGNHPKVYGFLLKDDVATAPFPSHNNVNPIALWVYRWHYQMIRNTAEGQQNSYNRDLAPGKKVIVTMPFEYADASGNEITNPFNSLHFAVGYHYSNNIPSDFFTPGNAWDIIMPYWYPHKRQISAENEEYLMDILYSEMSSFFPQESMMPIMQVVEETEPQHSKFTLEHGFDLSIQYNKFIQHGLLGSQNKAIAYYSANGHAGVYDNLLHKNWVRDATTSNIYYREAEIMNNYHFQLFGNQ